MKKITQIFASLVIVSVVIVGVAGCGIFMSEADIADAQAQKAFLTKHLETMDPTLRAQAEAAIADIDKKIAEGNMGWNLLSLAGGALGTFFPGLAVVGNVVKKSRRSVTGVFDIVELALGEDNKFDKTKASDLMDQHPQLRAQFQAWRQLRAAAMA